MRHAQAGFGIVAIDVENGSLHHARDIRGIGCGARLVGIGGESDLVVDHQMDGAAGGVAFELRKIEGFGHHALSGESCVAVDQDGDYALAFRIAEAILLGPDDAFRHGIDGFQVTGVERHRHNNLASAGRLAHAAGAKMIFHVARALRAVRIDTFKFGQNLHQRLVDNVRQHVEPAAVRHADHRFVHVGIGGEIQNLVQNHHGRFRAFERKALVTDKTRVQEMFELLGLDHALERALARVRMERPAIAGELHTQLQPALLFRNLDVHVLASDFSAIGVAQGFQNLAQRGHFLRLVFGRHQVTGEKLAVQVPNSKSVGCRIEFRVIGGFRTQRVKVGDQVSTHAVRIDELKNSRFFGYFVEFGSTASGHGNRPVFFPMHRLVRDLEVLENFFVEMFLAFEQCLQAA